MSVTTASSWTPVCAQDALIPNLGTCALFDGKQVAMFKVDGELFAIDNYDPISGANVLSRGIIGDIQGQLVVASPLYKQHFDLRSGQCIERDDVCLNVYQIREHDGNIELAIA